MTSMGKGRTVALLMSGGVDSTVAALLLQKSGWRVVGLTLCIPGLDGRPVETGESAAQAASRLGIPHKIIRDEGFFAKRVAEPFLRSYREGRTPNPCADCNRFIKFGLLPDAAEDWMGEPVPVASGHYAQVLQTPSGPRLACASDPTQDQSYFLCDLRKETLRRLIFPLGALTKQEVRGLAKEKGLDMAEKTDSMEVCFLRGQDYRSFLGEDRPGDILDEKGRFLGRHHGLSRYTVGQRKGLGLSLPTPLYVLKLDVPSNSLIIGPREFALTHRVCAECPNILAPEFLAGWHRRRFAGKVRSYASLASCRIERLERDELVVTFDEPQFAPAAGQRLVLYHDGILVVSGVIV
ncbi:MAG: tRNA 2-thiouridine(34) synthase MnmA [Fretibacterium sp.]|nr:tRNA 2-thiouridine(34) synthase MnmA [Fretibacterium sp.]